MNSGIGDKKELQTKGIHSIVDLPDVGKNLSVQVGTKLAYLVNSTDTYDDIIRNDTLRAQLLDLWNRKHQGPLVDSVASHFAYARLSKNSSLLNGRADPAAGINSPHFQIDIEVSYLSVLGATPLTYFDFPHHRMAFIPQPQRDTSSL